MKRYEKTALRERLELGKEVHAAWRDGMIHQGRPVSKDRMKWDTLHPLDHGLDRYIGDRMVRFFESRGWRRHGAIVEGCPDAGHPHHGESCSLCQPVERP